VFKWAVDLLKCELLGKKERKMIHKIIVNVIKESVCEMHGIESSTLVVGIRKNASPVWLITIVSLLSFCPTFPRSEVSFLKSFALAAFDWGRRRMINASFLNVYAL
jgi:hypothetical protein